MTARRTAPFAFIDAPLDRAEHLRDDAEALARLWADGRVLVVDAEGRAWADDQGQLLAPPCTSLGPMPADALFLGLRGDEGWFAMPAASAVESGEPPGVDLRTAAGQWPGFEATAFAQARAVLHWRARHRHCGACGTTLTFARAGWLGRCPGCALEHYPRTDPAVIVAVSDGARLLLGRSPAWPPRRYSVLAGFVEPGESLEQTVVREVFEESAVRVRACRYLGSQPWPFPSSLMLGFAADAEPDVPRCNDELEDARWFDRDEVGAALRGESGDDGLLLSPSISISRWLIEGWYAGTG
ncbi:NAD(+) diphosphatase [Luteimonas sp. MC1572]|uniref:NAD(+) diphosphatase n=1 Tax=Luteimonas sp. MC1572 TaxID=2799325 RepID=UPI0018F0B9EE|nr:NAD(+) diphosphatase [Luteimonas sp. MC1572]MBJ6982297.1 NAD(+) diphosphatase [Luteimonas sp. MC1572]QQO03567.1 NAD(+) diphosphatase [Luteimonas sp. MC1572]